MIVTAPTLVEVVDVVEVDVVVVVEVVVVDVVEVVVVAGATGPLAEGLTTNQTFATPWPFVSPGALSLMK